ncbi:MAG: four helix bundle protein [Pirellulales bacterium]
MSDTSYKDLKVWQEGVSLSLGVYKLAALFPEHQKFGLVSQLRRCAVSVPSNIAEGHARLSTREYIRHVATALGSLAERETQLHISRDLNYGHPALIDDALVSVDIRGKQLRSLSHSLKRRIQ